MAGLADAAMSQFPNFTPAPPKPKIDLGALLRQRQAAAAPTAPAATGPDFWTTNAPQATVTAPDPMQGQLTQNFNQNNLGASGAPTGGTAGTFTPPTGVDMLNDPGYQFRIDQGNRSVQNSAFSQGKGLTGGALKALLNYGQGAASQEYGNVFNRALQGAQFNQATNFGNTDRALNSYLASRDTFWGDNDRLFNRNFSLATLGANAAGNYAGSAGDLTTGMGNAGAAGTIGAGNAIGAGISQGGSMAALLAGQKLNAGRASTQPPVYGGGAFQGIRF